MEIQNELLPEVKKFKDPGVLFMTDRKMEREMDSFNVVSAAMQVWYCCVVVEMGAEREGKVPDLSVSPQSNPYLRS